MNSFKQLSNLSSAMAQDLLLTRPRKVVFINYEFWSLIANTITNKKKKRKRKGESESVGIGNAGIQPVSASVSCFYFFK